LAGGIHFYPLGPAEAKAITTVKQVFITGLGSSRIRQVTAKGNAYVLYLESVRQVERAKALVHEAVFADIAALPEIPEAFYFDLLIGSRATLDGEDYGEVVDVMDAGGQVVVEVSVDRTAEDEAAGRKVLVPLAAPYVTVDEGVIRLCEPPTGLLDDGDE
jgi:ribosomal 30S subunit maturation factor RimM